MLLSSDAESFFRLADAAQEVRRQLKQSGVLQVILFSSSIWYLAVHAAYAA